MTRAMVLSGVVGFVMAVCGTLVGLVVALPAVVQAQASSIRAEQFTVIDPDGAERIRLQTGPGIGAGLGVLDAEHRVRLSARTGGPVAVGGMLADVAGFAVLNPDGTPAAVLGAGRGSQGNLPLTNNLVLFDLQGRPRVALLVAADGTPSMQLLDANGNVTWRAQ